MKKLLSLLVVLSLVVLTVGCGDGSGSSPKGSTTPTDGGGGGGDAAKKATVWVDGDVTVKVEETKDVTVQLKREGYEGKVEAKVTAPAENLKVEPATITFEEGKSEATIKVTGVKESEEAVEIKFEITTEADAEKKEELKANPVKVTVEKKPAS